MTRQFVVDLADLNAFTSDLSRLIPTALEEFEQALNEALPVLEGEIFSRTPDGATGDARQSIGYDLGERTPLMAEGEVFMTEPYGPPLEFGRQPGKMPPVDAIEYWVRRKLGIMDDREARSTAYVIARAIGRRGTVGRFMFQLGLSAAEPYILKLFDAAVDRMLQRLASE